MRIIADFHIHSKYSRATSKEMDVETLTRYAKIKGIDVLGTGDFTHPLYFVELARKLEPAENGLLKLKNSATKTRFILTAEVSNIFSWKGQFRKIHILIFAPSFEVVERINGELSKRGKLGADGRPIFGFHVKDIVKIALDVSPQCLLVPAHAWTPWFSLFGSRSGFNTVEECFEEETENIFAIETGLSSDPAMNWRLSALDGISLISNSDAHSPMKIGREANVFECNLDYDDIIGAIKNKNPEHFCYTVEFFPEEGKYHYDGHRNCNTVSSPGESKQNDGICPVCRKRMTLGVMSRIEDLADRQAGYIPAHTIPYRSLIPLHEVIAEVLGTAPETKGVRDQYNAIVERAGSEFKILLDLSRGEMASFVPAGLLNAIMKMREGRVSIIPGYDGVYGKISILGEHGNAEPFSVAERVQPQMELFS